MRYLLMLVILIAGCMSSDSPPAPASETQAESQSEARFESQSEAPAKEYYCRITLCSTGGAALHSWDVPANNCHWDSNNSLKIDVGSGEVVWIQGGIIMVEQYLK